MTQTNCLISELTEGDRKSAEKQVKTLRAGLQRMFRECDLYLKDYGEGTQNVGKLFGVLEQTRGLIEDAIPELIQRHRT